MIERDISIENLKLTPVLENNILIYRPTVSQEF
jgi:hypothetical protein